jgi:hydroxymethylpyrimidine/phosphomethylpyrimidine kinase
MKKNILIIAGLDPTGGAGLLADIETASLFGVRSFAVATALTGQSSLGVSASSPVDASQVEAQLAPLLEDFSIHAIKIGMLGTAANVRAVARLLRPLAQTPIVLDPVLCSSSGHALLDEEGRSALLTELMPRSHLVTPNLDEARLLSGVEDAVEGARRLAARAILLKGGHRAGDASIDTLFRQGSAPKEFPAKRVALPEGANVRGTGCRLASGIAARLALGDSLDGAIHLAKDSLLQKLQGELTRLGRGPALFL